ncbi:xylulokinase [Herbiconiux sp. YIM B11900]|uniref:xylulokinase n=1 Tax=Herbiconiux sp. YIM B11900 TaxID=3404131 RepID=UPI003F858F78
MTGPHPAVVAVDVGTSAVRAAVVDADRGILDSVRIARSDGVGGETFDPMALLDDVVAALSALGGPGTPAALCLSAHIGTVAVDSQLRPVAHGGGWADSRGSARLAAVAPGLRAELLAAAGRPAPTGGALALALDLMAGPERGEVAALLSPKGFLVAHLTGTIATDTVDAAYTLASDVYRGGWQQEALRSLGVPAEWFPAQLAPHAVVGGISASAAARCGLPAGTPVIAGGPDGSVGIGVLLGASTEAIADVAGTTDVIARLIARPGDAPAGSLVNPAIAPGLWTAGGATGLSGGAVARWRALLGAVDDPQLAAVPVGCDGLRIVPTMTGGRFPRWDSGSRGAVVGQSPRHGAAEVLRAAQEGAAFTVREGLDLLDGAAAGERLPIVLAGGSARSAHVAQLRADATGRVVRVCRDPDVTILGAAALALIGSGQVADLDEARSRLGIGFDTIEPRQEATRRYDEVYADWTALRDRL